MDGEGIMGDWENAAGLCPVLRVPFALVVMGLGRGYRQAVTAFAARSVQSNYKLTAQTASGQKKALLKKEMQRFLVRPCTSGMPVSV